MWYWDGDKMTGCRGLLQERARKMKDLAQECRDEIKESALSAEDSRCLSVMSDRLLAAAGFGERLSGSIARIDKIYRKNEEKIADYFDLVIQTAPHTELGVSTFESLEGHEKQMPFERRN